MSAASNRIDFQVKAGSAQASSDPRRTERLLTGLRTELNMDGPVSHCMIEFGDLEQEAPAPGDPVEISLDNGDGRQTVFTGQVAEARATATGQQILAYTSLTPLGSLELESVYEGVAADFVLKDLIEQGGATAGTIAPGPDLNAYVIHRGPTVLGHLRQLALLCGADLVADGSDTLHCLAPDPGATEHAFKFGASLLRLDLRQRPPAFDSIEVWGEGAASAKGADKAHWLSTDLSGVSGKASVNAQGQVQSGTLGRRPLRLIEGALRSGEAAEAVAKAWATRIASLWVRGSVDVYCSPAVQPGEHVKITDLPASHPASTLLAQGRTLRVRQVCHRLDRQRGAITTLGF